MMTYEQFKNIPVEDHNNLYQMMDIKLCYNLELTKFEEVLLGYFDRFSDENEIQPYKNYLERCFVK